MSNTETRMAQINMSNYFFVVQVWVTKKKGPRNSCSYRTQCIFCPAFWFFIPALEMQNPALTGVSPNITAPAEAYSYCIGMKLR